MTKRKIITLAIIIFVIVGALVALSIITTLDNAEELLPEELPERIFVLGDHFDASPPQALTIETHNRYGSFTVVNTNPDENPPHRFTLQGFEDFNLRNNRLVEIGNAARSMAASDVLFEGGADLSALGLVNPSATVTITYTDGTSAVLLIGDEVPGGGGAYAMREGSPTVYLIPGGTANSFMFRDLDFVNTLVTEIVETLPDISKAVLGGNVRSEPIVVERAPVSNNALSIVLNTHVIVSPWQGRLHSTHGLEPIAHSFGLTAVRVEAQFESTDELAEWGLDEPYSTLEVTSDAHESFKLIASEPDEEGLAYLVREGWPFIFRVNRQAVPWLELTYFEMMDPLLILPQIDTVSLLEIRLPDRTVNITLEGEGQYLEVFVDGVLYEAQEDVDSVRNFRTLYQDFLVTRYESIPENPMPPDLPIILQFTYNYRDGSPPDTVTIYEGAARRVFVQLNDETPMFGLSSFVDHLLRSIDSFLAGERVVGYF